MGELERWSIGILEYWALNTSLTIPSFRYSNRNYVEANFTPGATREALSRILALSSALLASLYRRRNSASFLRRARFRLSSVIRARAILASVAYF